MTIPDTTQTQRLASRWRRPLVMRDFGEPHRASTWLELFLDLCFVVAVAALAADLHSAPTATGILRFLGLFVPVWWAWMGFTWFATTFDNDDVPYRVAMMAAMLCILWLGASVGGVAKGGATSFVLAYVALRLVLIVQFARAWTEATVVREFCRRYVLGNALGVLVWLSSLVVPGPPRSGVWALGLLIELLTPMLARGAVPVRIFHAGHIRER